MDTHSDMNKVHLATLEKFQRELSELVGKDLDAIERFADAVIPVIGTPLSKEQRVQLYVVFLEHALDLTIGKAIPVYLKALGNVTKST